MSAKELLLSLHACPDAISFAEGKTIREAWETCHRGDWMLWLHSKQFPNDIRKLTLAKAYCANTVRHLMTDERSKHAIDVAIKFGYGFATLDELKAAARDALNAAYAAARADTAADAACAAASRADIAADAAAYAAASAAYAAYAASAVAAAAYAADAASAVAAKKQNQLLTADICRQLLDISSLYEIENSHD
jgi:hypothetical protein